jgi:hypothetical protein
VEEGERGQRGTFSMRGEGEGGSECWAIQGCRKHSATVGLSLGRENCAHSICWQAGSLGGRQENGASSLLCK